MRTKSLEEIAGELDLRKEMKNLQFLGISPLRSLKIAEYDNKPQEFDEATTKQVNKKWKALTKKVLSAFSGSLGSLRSFTINNEVIKLSLQRSNFGLYYGTKEGEERTIDLSKKLLDEKISLPISLGGVSVTKDGYIPVGLRGDVTFGKWEITPLPSGFFDPVNQIVYDGNPEKGISHPSFLVLLATELEEELNVEWFEKIKILGIIQDCAGSQQPMVAVRIGLPYTMKEMEKKVSSIENKEMDKIFFIENSKEAVKEMVERGYSWVPHGAGNLILHFAEEG